MSYIAARKKAHRQNLQDEASILFRTASIIARMFNGRRGERFQLMKEYDFLWTDAERKQAKVNAIVADMEAMNKRIRARKAKEKAEQEKS